MGHMSQVEHIPKTYEEAVVTLAQWGGEAGPDDLRTFAAENVGDEVVRIIHVSADFPNTVKIPVFTFGASEEFPFRSVVALARPEDWEEIRSGTGEKLLPPDWKLSHPRQLWPATEASAA